MRPLHTLLIGAALLAAGCAVKSGQPTTEPAVQSSTVIVQDTPYYAMSPAQASPPDGKFKKGTHVQVIGDAGSYVKVLDESTGASGYVPRNAISEGTER